MILKENGEIIIRNDRLVIKNGSVLFPSFADHHGEWLDAAVFSVSRCEFRDTVMYTVTNHGTALGEAAFLNLLAAIQSLAEVSIE